MKLHNALKEDGYIFCQRRDLVTKELSGNRLQMCWKKLKLKDFKMLVNVNVFVYIFSIL